MVIDIARLVRDCIPPTRSIERLSVACVHTTRPKYLVFADDPCRPAYVLQFGPGEELERTHRALLHLHPRIPDTIAESLVCTRLNAGESVHIQSGLPGLPWFRVADTCHARADWTALVERSAAVLARLQAVVADNPDWTAAVRPARELRERLTASRDPILAAHASTIARWTDALDSLGYVRAAWQHGDFSINNLLIGDPGIGIIDFDEFGGTMMPLHDEIGLALSFPLSQHGACPLSMEDCLQLCLGPTLSHGVFDGDAVCGLLLHHLLWRIEQCHARPTRDLLRATLMRYLHNFIVNPEGLLGGSILRPANATV
jgi:hypothetical protein